MAVEPLNSALALTTIFLLGMGALAWARLRMRQDKAPVRIKVEDDRDRSPR